MQTVWIWTWVANSIIITQQVTPYMVLYTVENPFNGTAQSDSVIEYTESL